MKIIQYKCPVCKNKETFFLSNWEIWGMFGGLFDRDEFLEFNKLEFLKWYINLFKNSPIIHDPEKEFGLVMLGNVFIDFTRVCMFCEKKYNNSFVMKKWGDNGIYEIIDYQRYSENHPRDLYLYLQPYYMLRKDCEVYQPEARFKIIEWEKFKGNLECENFNL